MGVTGETKAAAERDLIENRPVVLWTDPGGREVSVRVLSIGAAASLDRIVAQIAELEIETQQLQQTPVGDEAGAAVARYRKVRELQAQHFNLVQEYVATYLELAGVDVDTLRDATAEQITEAFTQLHERTDPTLAMLRSQASAGRRRLAMMKG